MSEREIKIGFGTLFRVAGEKDRTDVIVEVGENNYFGSAKLRETEDGKRWFFLAGSGGKKHIGEIVGELTLNEVINALEEGARQVGLKELPEEMRDTLKQESGKKPRLLR